MKVRFVALAALALLPVLGNAAPCESEDFENRISGASTCLLIKRFGVTETGAGQPMLIWLHGDLSSGGAATYHFALDATHNSVVRSQMVSDAIAGLVNDR